MTSPAFLGERLKLLQKNVRQDYEESGRARLDAPKIEAAAAVYAEDKAAHHSSGYQSNDSAPDETAEEFGSEGPYAQVNAQLRNMSLHSEDLHNGYWEPGALYANAPAQGHDLDDGGASHWTQEGAQWPVHPNATELYDAHSISDERSRHTGGASLRHADSPNSYSAHSISQPQPTNSPAPRYQVVDGPNSYSAHSISQPQPTNSPAPRYQVVDGPNSYSAHSISQPQPTNSPAPRYQVVDGPNSYSAHSISQPQPTNSPAPRYQVVDGPNSYSAHSISQPQHTNSPAPRYQVESSNSISALDNAQLNEQLRCQFGVDSSLASKIAQFIEEQRSQHSPAPRHQVLDCAHSNLASDSAHPIYEPQPQHTGAPAPQNRYDDSAAPRWLENARNVPLENYNEKPISAVAGQTQWPIESSLVPEEFSRASRTTNEWPPREAQSAPKVYNGEYQLFEAQNTFSTASNRCWPQVDAPANCHHQINQNSQFSESQSTRWLQPEQTTDMDSKLASVATMLASALPENAEYSSAFSNFPKCQAQPQRLDEKVNYCVSSPAPSSDQAYSNFPEYQAQSQQQPQAYLLVDATALQDVDITKPPPQLPADLLNSPNSDTARGYVRQAEIMVTQPPAHQRVQYCERHSSPQAPANVVLFAAQQIAQSAPYSSGALYTQAQLPEMLHGDAPLSDSRYLHLPLPDSPPQGVTPEPSYSDAFASPHMTSATGYFDDDTSTHFQPIDCARRTLFNSNVDDDVELAQFGAEPTIDEYRMAPASAVLPLASSPPSAPPKLLESARTAQARGSLGSGRAAITAQSTPTEEPNARSVRGQRWRRSGAENRTAEGASSTPESAQTTPPNVPNGARKEARGNTRNSSGSAHSTPGDRRQRRSNDGRYSNGSAGPGSGQRSKRPSFTPEEEEMLSASLRESYGYPMGDLLERCFSKRNSFSGPCSLRSMRHPYAADKLFTYPRWSQNTCGELAQLKERLNAVKERLSSYDLNDWHRHTRTTNPADMVMRRLRSDVKVEFLTQAWCKFYELMHSFNLVPREARKKNELYSVHLCEAPGAFVASLNHFLRLNHKNMRWRWMANSLNPYYEGNHLSAMINDDRFMLQTIEKWDFGPDMTGDIMHPDYPDHLRSVCGDHLPHLVTADGSFDCQDKPEEQEKLVSWLHFKEALTAIRILRKGGHFVLKMFTFFECESVCLLFLLRCVFESIDIMKPATSKEGNSEVYVVCREFKDDVSFEPFIRHLLTVTEKQYSRSAMLSYEQIPRTFMLSVLECAEKFARLQTEVIERNIRLFQHERYAEYRRHFELVQEKLFEQYVRRYGIEPIELSETVVRMPYKRVEQRRSFASPKVVEQREHKQGSHEDQQRRCGLEKRELVRVVTEELAEFPRHRLHSEVSDVPKVDIECRDVQVRCGKPIHTITSSQFCHGTVIRLRNEVMNTVKHKDYYVATADMERSAEIEKNPQHFPNLCDLSECLMLMKNYNDTQRRIFHKLYEHLEGQKENVTLFSFPLLTQFNISVLCILNRMYKSIQFEPPNILYLRDLDTKNFERWMPKMSEIRNTYTENQAIISILPIRKITGSKNEFYTWVIEANNAQIIHEINLFSSFHS